MPSEIGAPALDYFLAQARQGRVDALAGPRSQAWHLACAVLNLQRRLTPEGRQGLFAFLRLAERDPRQAAERLLTAGDQLRPYAGLDPALLNDA